MNAYLLTIGVNPNNVVVNARPGSTIVQIIVRLPDQSSADAAAQALQVLNNTEALTQATGVQVLGVDTLPHVEILASEAPSPPPPLLPPPSPPPPSFPPSAPPPWWSLPCEAGTEQTPPDGICVPCNPGTYQSDTGAGVRQVCIECEKGTLQPDAARTQCIACPDEGIK